MNYQQAIADAIKQITFRSVAAAVETTADAAAGSGFSCFCAAVAAATDSAALVCQMAADADVAATMDAATTADAAAGSGFSCFCAAVAATTAADADAANVLTYGGPYMRALNHCHMA